MCEEGKASRTKTFLSEMKKSLSQVNFDCIVQALQTYKKTDNLDVLLTETVVLAGDANTHSLLRGKSCSTTCSLHQFLRPTNHKKINFFRDLSLPRFLPPRLCFSLCVSVSLSVSVTWSLMQPLCHRYIPVCSSTSQEEVWWELPGADWAGLWIQTWSLTG